MYMLYSVIGITIYHFFRKCAIYIVYKRFYIFLGTYYE